MLQAKAGIAATRGTQTAPAVDAGYVALAVVTVANGQSTVTSGNIVAVSSGQVLGAPISSGRLLNTQVFVASGTYTPTPGTNSIVVEGCGAGSGGGATAACSGSQSSAGAGGSSGAYGKSRYTGGFTGGIAVTIGAGGNGGTAAGAAPAAGGASSFGALLTLPGGLAVSNSPASTPPLLSPGSVLTGSNSPTGANIFGSQGQAGSSGMMFITTSGQSGSGGSTPYGTGATGRFTSTSGNGASGIGFGSGGGGGATTASGTAQSGGNGAPGIVIVWEYA